MCPPPPIIEFATPPCASAITDLLRFSLANEFNAISDKHIAKAFPMKENAPLLCCCSKIGCLT